MSLPAQLHEPCMQLQQPNIMPPHPRHSQLELRVHVRAGHLQRALVGRLLHPHILTSWSARSAACRRIWAHKALQGLRSSNAHDAHAIICQPLAPYHSQPLATWHLKGPMR